MPERQAHRPTTLAPRGMVSSPHYLASAAGLRVLQAEGNAVDAAIATTAVCSVVYPHMCGIGGDSFWLVYEARGPAVRALNGSGRSGERCTIDLYRKAGIETAIPRRGPLACNTVPGAVDAWAAAYECGRAKLGTSVAWASLFEDAIAYAVDGFPVTASQAHWTLLDVSDETDPLRGLRRFEGFRRTYLRADGQSYREGEIFRQPDLGRTLRQIADQGARAFYEGEIASRIVKSLEEEGGVLSARDFAEHRSDWMEPLRTTYRGYEVNGFPPNTQGLSGLIILNILSQFDVGALRDGTADYLHLQAEAVKLAFADRDRWVTDPAFVQAPLGRLLSPEYAAERARLIRMDRATPGYEAGRVGGDTIAVAVVDPRGNAVSMLQSLYFDFGSGIVAGNTGVLLQNRGSFFSLEPTHVNRLEPGKRTFHTLVPSLLTRGGRGYLISGAMGGEGQPQTGAALITRIVDFGMGVQEAVEAPRWLYGRTWGTATTDLLLEARVPSDTVEDLRRRGHPVRVVGAWDELMGHAQAIRIDPDTGVRQGAADPRGDGLAVGY